jgi:hypothetical protein
LFERAEWLRAQGVTVELLWVKGHANSKANKLADYLASEAVDVQAIDLIREQSFGLGQTTRFMTVADVPTMYTELGSDWVDEWLSRTNKEFCEYPRPINRDRFPPKANPVIRLPCCSTILDESLDIDARSATGDKSDDQDDVQND